MSIRDELLAIKGNKELLIVDDAVQWAKDNPESMLHGRLDWDNETAGHQWRCQQIRQLIAVYVIEDEGHREMISLSIDRTHGGGYRSIDEVVPIQSLREIMLADALKDLDRLQQKYKRLEELASVWAAKETVRTQSRRRERRARTAEQRQTAP
jgi:hypothetical protein